MDHPHPTSIELGDTFHINKKEKEKKKDQASLIKLWMYVLYKSQISHSDST